MEVSNSYFSERVDLGLSYFLRLASARLQEILWFVLHKRSISSIINIFGDIRNKRQRIIAIFLWTCAKALQKKLRQSPHSCYSIGTAMGKGQEPWWEGESKKWLNRFYSKFPHRGEFTFGLKPGTKNSQSKKKCFGQGHIKLEKGASCESWSTVVCLACAITCFAFSFLNDIMLPVSSETNRDLLILPIFPICSRGTLVSFANLFHFIRI